MVEDEYSLSPVEAAYIAANVYFTLEGWEATYRFKKMNGSDAKGAPKPKAGIETQAIINRNVVGSGPLSVNKAGINNAGNVNAFVGSTGLNLTGRTRSGFGYFLQFVRDNKKHLVIATRGTRPEMGMADLITDANISLNRSMAGVGPVHAGFYDAFNSIRPNLDGSLDLIKDADVVHCVGHSLGGAVANLVALYIAKIHNNIKLYTFGAPRVGTRDAAYPMVVETYLGKENIYRMSHNFDPIPMIPVAPYIHALPKLKDENNLFVASPVSSISMDNHDTNNYIGSVTGKTWSDIRSDKMQEGYLSKQYFNSWRASDSWLKQYIGRAINAQMAILQRVLQGLIDTLGVGFTEVATILDLLSMAIEKGIEIYQVSKSYVTKFIKDCASLFGMAVDISKEVLRKLFKKMMTEITLAAKLAVATASKTAKSKEFRLFLAAASAGSIGFLMI